MDPSVLPVPAEAIKTTSLLCWMDWMSCAWDSVGEEKPKSQ